MGKPPKPFGKAKAEYSRALPPKKSGKTKKGHAAVTLKAYINRLNVLCPLLCDGQNFTSVACRHSLSEAVLLLSVELLRLIGSQHIKNPPFTRLLIKMRSANNSPLQISIIP